MIESMVDVQKKLWLYEDFKTAMINLNQSENEFANKEAAGEYFGRIRPEMTEMGMEVEDCDAMIGNYLGGWKN